MALWSGEEEGLLGCRVHPAAFRVFEKHTQGYGALSAYLTLDNGTGRVRGAEVFGPASAATVVRMRWRLSPSGSGGAIATRAATSAGSDHTAFNNAGLPRNQLPAGSHQYETHTHHTNLDTYERVVEEARKRRRTVIAATVYHLAMSDEMLPRFRNEDTHGWSTVGGILGKPETEI